MDPRRTETAALAGQRIFIQPGRDALLLLALIHTLYGEDLLNPGRLADFTDGFDEIALIAADFAPEDVASRLGIPAETIRQLARELAAAERGVVYGRYLLSLIGRRQLRSNNSWMHNSLRLVKGKNRCALLMRPADAAARGLTDGQTVKVCSRVGEIELPLEVTEGIMPGVVSVPHGWGHNRPGVQMRVAQAHPGASLNDLTDDRRVDELTGNAAFSGVPVEVVEA